jgi:hypothetical protein
VSGAIIEAVVQVGVAETRYLRCGRGARPIVILAEDAAARDALMQRFGDEYRVIAPVSDGCTAPAPADVTALEQWLRGVIDGLGLVRPAVALSPGMAWLAERLVSQCGDAIDVVLSVAQPDG